MERDLNMIILEGSLLEFKISSLLIRFLLGIEILIERIKIWLEKDRCRAIFKKIQFHLVLISYSNQEWKLKYRQFKITTVTYYLGSSEKFKIIMISLNSKIRAKEMREDFINPDLNLRKVGKENLLKIKWINYYKWRLMLEVMFIIYRRIIWFTKIIRQPQDHKLERTNRILITQNRVIKISN